MRLRLIALGLLVLLAACDRTAAPAAHTAAVLPPTANQAASDFVSKIVGEDLFELRIANIAAARAKVPAVKAFAQRAAEDQVAAKAQLDQAVRDSGQALPEPAQLPDHLQAMLDELGKGTAADFDKTYVEQQIETDQDVLSLMSAYARDGAAPAIKAAARNLAPAVQARLELARTLEDALNKDP